MKISNSCYMLSGFGFEPPWSVNAGFVAGPAETLIVDAGPSASAADTILGYARAVRPENPIRVVNTEQHLDHMLGNGVFADAGIEILGHASIRREPADLEAAIESLAAATPDETRRRAGEARLFYAGTRVQNPTARLDGETALDLGGLIVRLLPAPGHTPSNLLVWVEAERVLFTGDTIVAGYLPNLSSGNPDAWRGWLAALERIESLHPAIVVPGHGCLLRDGPLVHEISRIRTLLHEAVSHQE